MSAIGKNSLSFRKKDVQAQKSIGVGFKKIVFAHKATLGDTGINLASLAVPTEMSSLGFTNPSVADITAANLFFYRKNLTLISSLRGNMADYLSYSVGSSTRINFEGFTAEDGEIFIGTLDPVAKTELKVVDAAPLISTGTLAVGVTDYNVGTPFTINTYPLTQVGSVIVYRNGIQQFRNTNNGLTGGNYYEVNAGAGLGTIIRFNNAPSGIDDNILVVSNGLLAERPDGSMMAAIENIAGQLDQVIPTVAALAGVPESNFQTAPNNVDLKQFGDIVLALQRTRVKKYAYLGTLATTGTWVTNTSYVGKYWQDGQYLVVDVTVSLTGAPDATQLIMNLPAGYTINTALMSSSDVALKAFEGTGQTIDGGNRQNTVTGIYLTSTTYAPTVLNVTGANTFTSGVTQLVPFTWANTDSMNYIFRIPVNEFGDGMWTLEEAGGL